MEVKFLEQRWNKGDRFMIAQCRLPEWLIAVENQPRKRATDGMDGADRFEWASIAPSAILSDTLWVSSKPRRSNAGLLGKVSMIGASVMRLKKCSVA